MKIESSSQYYEALAVIETFIETGFRNLNAQETEELREISLAVESFEKQKFPIPVSVTIPELLEEYMHENRMNQMQLSELLGMSNSTMSEIISGKRKANLTVLKKLCEKLHIDGNFLLETA